MKVKYVQPIIDLTIIEMEESIATSSATVNTGGTSNEPKIEEWDNTPTGSFKTYDM
ncbi:hypothetical protein [Sphingobacterium sp.]|uniref:hypothetical protein n=1 Tax=Sphingobacterium sp. TaxID=341027 RepID=UPI0028A290DF|nr:hypothetical protein [Sphingobacterium sp.]